MANRVIVLVGDLGPVSGFAALRAQHYQEALAESELRLVDWRAVAQQVAEGTAGALTAGADCVVAAGNFGPTRAALAIAGELPLWVDFAGDPFAEAQAGASRAREAGDLDGAEGIAAEAASVFVPALLRADAFGCVSARGRLATIGALGATGRLARLDPAIELVHVVPIAASFGFDPAVTPAAEPRGRGLRIALFGSFNNWFDEEGLAAGLLGAIDRAWNSGRIIDVVVTGGAVEGHFGAGFRAFQARIASSPHAARVSYRGWVEHDALPGILRSCDVAICMDRPGAEPELGSRTRVLYALLLGLRVLATPRTELVRDLVADGLVTPIERNTLADVLVALAGAASLPRANAGFLATRYSIAATTLPLKRWAADPKRARPAPGADALVAVTAERDALRAELAALRASPTWKTLDRIRKHLP